MSAAQTFRAFPSAAIADEHGGMSLRDWFAGQALAGFTVAPNSNIDPHRYAEASYLLADAMMEQREFREVGQ